MFRGFCWADDVAPGDVVWLKGRRIVVESFAFRRSDRDGFCVLNGDVFVPRATRVRVLSPGSGRVNASRVGGWTVLRAA